MVNRTITLLTRSLRVDARLLRTHLFRLLFTGFICLNLVTAHDASRFRGAPGLEFFTTMSYLNYIFISLAGVSFFATSITEEKEEDTLGLLKMAGVGPVAILLGKSTSRLVSAGLLLLVQLPFTFLAITLGGVTIVQVIDSYCALTAYLILLANVGLFASVICRHSKQAAGVVLGFLIAWAALPSFLETLNWLVTESPSGIFKSGIKVLNVSGIWLNEASITHRIKANTSTGFNESVFGLQFISNLGFAVVLFLLSWAMFDRCTRDLSSSTGPSRGLVFTKLSRLSLFRCGRTWANALMWKDFYFGAGGPLWLLLKFLLYGGLAVVFACFKIAANDNYYNTVSRISGEILPFTILIGCLEASLVAGGIFHSEIKWKTLPTLMMLPLSIAEIIWSKFFGSLFAMLPLCFYFGVTFSLTESSGRDLFRALAEPEFWFVILYFIAFLHLTALLSMVVRWGAIPLAFGILIAVAWTVGVTCLSGSASAFDALFGILDFFVVVAIAILHGAIHNRLRDAAAQ